MANDSSQLGYATDGKISVAPYGTALPESINDELDPAFVELGYATTDGATESYEQEVAETEAWQSATPIDKRVTKRTKGLSATLLQTNRDNYALAFGGGEWTETAPGEFEYDPPADTDELPEYVVVLDVYDEDIHDRIILKRATMTEGVEVQHVRNEAAKYPLKWDALTPDGETRSWKKQSNNPAFGEGS